MRRVLKKRQDKMRAFFDSVAGRLGKDYVPGKSWKSMAEALLRLMPPMVIADLGAGEGAFALLLAQRAKQVIAVDTSAKMIEVGREQALRHGVKNVDYRLGDMEEIPIDDAVSTSSSSRSRSITPCIPNAPSHEAFRILSPPAASSFSICVKHRFEEARELYADEWLGFSEAELESMLEKAGFTHCKLRWSTKSQRLRSSKPSWRSQINRHNRPAALPLHSAGRTPINPSRGPKRQNRQQSELPRPVRFTATRRTAILKALADPRRFELLQQIAKASCPLGCAQARAALPISAATLSHHIKELEAAGLIHVEREGKFHFMTLRPGCLRASSPFSPRWTGPSAPEA